MMPREGFQAAHACTLAGVSRAGFYRHYQEHAPRQADVELRDHIHRVVLEFRAYGSPRVTRELRHRGVVVNHKRVERLMRLDNLVALHKRKYVLTTDSRHTYAVYPNLAAGLELTATNQLWVSDITYVRLRETFLYLAVVMDAYSRRVVGWQLGEDLTAEFALAALNRALADRVEGLLREYRRLSNGRLTLRVLDPEPASDAEDSAALDGVSPVRLPGGEAMYLGLAVSCLDKTVPIPFVPAEREAALEYDVTRAVCQVLRPEKPLVGVVSVFPVLGEALPGANAARPPVWAAFSELGRDFRLTSVKLEMGIPEETRVLLFLHPPALSPKAQYAVDQFLLRGGRIMAFLDPASWVAEGDPVAQALNIPPDPSTLGPALLGAWGVRFDTGKIVADLRCMTQVKDARGRPTVAPALLSLGEENRNATDPLTSRLGVFNLPFAGCFEVTPADGLRRTDLLFSSDSSALMPSENAGRSGEVALRGFKPDHKPKLLAVRLDGCFRTAFPGGAPGTAAPGLRESRVESAVVLVADSDMLYDRACVQGARNSFGSSSAVPANDNIAFLQNAVEYLAGDENLLRIRSRTVKARPFTVVNDMLVVAGRKYQARLDKLENDLADVQEKLMAAQRRPEAADSAAILPPGQQRAVEEFRKAQAETRRQIKTMGRELRRDIDRLGFRLRMFNIALVPALVGLAGLAAWLVRRWRRS
jgi:ABC-type uncharacterized transport system involved in gliding motility auxiliary subunit